jgi:DNA-binding MarR family transcriptional regulator
MTYDHLIGYNLIELARKINQSITGELAKEQITFPQYRVLSRLFASGPITQSQLSEYLSLRSATLTPMIAGMVDRGWIQRSADPQDGRRYLLQLTEEGVDVRHRAFDIVMQYERTKLRTLGEEESDLLIKWLHRLNISLDTN